MRNAIVACALPLLSCSGAGPLQSSSLEAAPAAASAASPASAALGDEASGELGPAPEAVHAGDARPAATAPDVSTARQGRYLVWGPGEDAAATGADDHTASLEPAGVGREREGETYVVGADGAMIARFSGVVLAAGGHLYRWSVRSVDVARQPCWAEAEQAAKSAPAPVATGDGAPENFDWLTNAAAQERQELANDPTRALDEASVVDVATGEARVVARFGEGAQDMSYEATLRASVGSLLFVHEAMWTYTCGAHGFGGSRVSVVDLRSGGTGAAEVAGVDLVALRAELSPATVGAARARAAAELGERRDWDCSFEGAELCDVELGDVLPRYGQNGELELTGRFATFAPYAFSEGDYAIHVVEPLAGPLPARFEGQAHAPDAVAAFLRAHPTVEVGGYSVVE